MNKIRYLFGLLVITSIMLAACGGPATTEVPVVEEPVVEEPTEEPAAEEATEEPAAEEEHAMALILIGIKDDNSFAEAGYDSLQRIGEQGLPIAYSESVDPADAPRVMREYIDQGYNMIICHAFQCQDAVFEVAAEHPEVNFAWAGGIQGTAENVADYDQPFYQAAYLVGILAGHMSEAQSLGALVGFDIPVCHAMGVAFHEGAKTVNPDINFVQTAVGHFQDIPRAREAALAQVDTAGVDFWIGCGPGPAVGSIEVAQEVGGYATGYVSDMSELGPDVVLSSIVWKLDVVFNEIYQQTLNDTFDNPWYTFGVAEGALEVEINPALINSVPDEAIADMEEAKSQIEAGTLEVPFVPE